MPPTEIPDLKDAFIIGLILKDAFIIGWIRKDAFIIGWIVERFRDRF